MGGENPINPIGSAAEKAPLLVAKATEVDEGTVGHLLPTPPTQKWQSTPPAEGRGKRSRGERGREGTDLHCSGCVGRRRRRCGGGMRRAGPRYPVRRADLGFPAAGVRAAEAPPPSCRCAGLRRVGRARNVRSRRPLRARPSLRTGAAGTPPVALGRTERGPTREQCEIVARRLDGGW